MADNRSLAAHEILDILENVSDDEDNRERIIYVLPPPVNPDCPTDEDSGDEENVTINNLPRNILLQPAEILVQGGYPSDEEEDQPTARRPKRRSTYLWRKQDLLKPVEWPKVLGAVQEKNPIEWFQDFFDGDVISLMVVESNKYAIKNNLSGDITLEEMKCFIGVLLVSGYACLPRRRMYWENSDDSKNKFIVAKWHDNNIFSIASNAVGVNPKQPAKRFSQSEKRNIMIEEPHILSIYNKHMGGVDRSDENISHYRVGIRGKKWYMPLLTHIMIDLAEYNVWQLYKRNNGKLDHLGFRRRVATALIESNRKEGKRGSSRPSQHEHADSRKDKINHLVVPQSKQTRCRQCHKKCLTGCKKCDVGVCVKCFETYHS